jgi:hypothetical protein
MCRILSKSSVRGLTELVSKADYYQWLKMAVASNSQLLRIYVARHCSTCREALRLAEEVRTRFNGVNVQVIDLEAENSQNLDEVFSVPTYILNGVVFSLGNPDQDQLFSVLINLVE